MQYAKVHTSTIRGKNYTAKCETRWSEEDSLVIMNLDGAQATQDEKDMDKEIERMEKMLKQKEKAKKLE